MPNADPAFVEVLAGIVRRELAAVTAYERDARRARSRSTASRRRFVVRRARDADAQGAPRRRAAAPARQEVWALREVSVAIEPGEAVGLIGRNGSGKSTLLRLIAGIIKPTAGRVEAGGRIGSLLELGAGFHPDFTGRENVYLNGSIQGLSRRADPRAVRRDRRVRRARALDRPARAHVLVGHDMRLGFAIAAFLEADVLLLDEVFAVGDENFQRKCFGMIAAFKQRGGTIVFVSHDALAVERLCERAVLLRDGRRRLRRPDARGDHALPPRARRRARPGASGDDGLRRVGHRRGADRRGPARSTADGEAREQFLAGEPLASRRRARRAPSLPPQPAPRAAGRLRARWSPRISSRRRASAGTGGRRSRPAPRRRARRRSRSGASRLRLALDRRRTAACCTGSTTRSPFLVYPDERGARARAPRRNVASRARTGESDELQDVPRLARADGARSGSAVQAHDRCATRSCRSRCSRRSRSALARARSRSAATSSITCSTPPTRDPEVVAALAGTHWFEVHEWATTGPGASTSARRRPARRLTRRAARTHVDSRSC